MTNEFVVVTNEFVVVTNEFVATFLALDKKLTMKSPEAAPAREPPHSANLSWNNQGPTPIPFPEHPGHVSQRNFGRL
jgi:hypothetical protein